MFHDDKCKSKFNRYGVVNLMKHRFYHSYRVNYLDLLLNIGIDCSENNDAVVELPI